MAFLTELGYRVELLRTGGDVTDDAQYDDITPLFETMDKLTDTGSGEIPSVKLTNDAREGDHVISGSIPIIRQYDIMRITIEDDAMPDGGNTYRRLMVVDDVQPQKNVTGTHLSLDLYGRERHLQKMHFTGVYLFRRFEDMLRIIVKHYNDNRGMKQPRLVLYDSDMAAFPRHAFGTFEFGPDTTVYDAIHEVRRRLNLSVADGGGGEQYAIFEEHAAGVDLVLRVIPRGTARDRRDVIVRNPLNITRTKHPHRGNVVIVQGQPGFGSMPRQVAEFRSAEEEYYGVPRYDPSFQYDMDAYCSFRGVVYRARRPTKGNAPVPLTTNLNWEGLTLRQYVNRHLGVPDAAAYDYSPWTRGRAADWRAQGGNPAGTLYDRTPGQAPPANTFGSLCFPDSNLVVRETTLPAGSPARTVWRDWADFRIRGNGGIPIDFGTVPYTGMRVLMDGPRSTRLFTSERDEFDRPYADAIIQYSQNGRWVVLRGAQKFDQCAVIYEGRIYAYESKRGTSTTGGRTMRGHDYSPADFAWQDVSASLLGNDCFHYPKSVENDTGLIDGPIITGDLNRNSSVKITYSHVENNLGTDISIVFAELFGAATSIFTGAANAIRDILGLTTDDVPMGVAPPTEAQRLAEAYAQDIYNNGWWCTLFEAPYPKTANQSPADDHVGDVYKPVTFSVPNLNETPAGNTGYAHPDSENLGALDGIAFLFRFDITGLTVPSILGNVPFRCAIYDIFGGVWVSDFTLRFQQETQHVRLPFSSFENYRSRLPVSFAIDNWISRVINPELRQTEIQDTYFLKRIVLHCLLPYDDQGRYDPYKLDLLIHNVIPTIISQPITYTGWVDAFHFTKAPLAIAKRDTSERHTADTIKKYPHVSNVIQLRKIARSELDISDFQRETVEFQIDELVDDVPLCAFRVDDMIRVEDENVIDGDSKPDPGLVNQRDYIVEKVTYSVGDRSSDSGMIATVLAYRRLGDA